MKNQNDDSIICENCASFIPRERVPQGIDLAGADGLCFFGSVNQTVKVQKNEKCSMFVREK